MMGEFNNFLQTDNEVNIDTLTLDVADESAVFLEALKDSCTPDEYNTIVTESATELELYGLIDTAEIATEAQRNIVKLNKQAAFSREEAKACFRLAKKANDPHFAKYKKYLDLKNGEKEYIYQKYGSRAKVVAKDVIRNSRRKASTMPSQTGKNIMAKMDKKIAEVSRSNK